MLARAVAGASLLARGRGHAVARRTAAWGGVSWRSPYCTAKKDDRDEWRAKGEESDHEDDALAGDHWRPGGDAGGFAYASEGFSGYRSPPPSPGALRTTTTAEDQRSTTTEEARERESGSEREREGEGEGEKKKRAKKERSVAAAFFRKEYRRLKADLKDVEGIHGEVIRKMSKGKPSAVFANHKLNMAEIETFGFDFDFVLASYTKALQPLIYNLAKERLVNDLKYPSDLLAFDYDPTFAVRGLHFDCKKGLLMKMDFMQNINPHTCYFGRQKLKPSSISQHYHGGHVSTQYFRQNFRHISDLFELSECTLLADVIQYFVDKDIMFDPAAIYRDINNVVQQLHRSTLHEKIKENPALYVHENNDLVYFLARIKKAGKEIFLLTNNVYKNVDSLMTYLTKAQWDSIGVSHWTEMFDVIMTKADKPNFYTSEDRPFRQLDKGSLQLTWLPVKAFVPGEVYVDGCLKELMKIKKFKKRSVLYMGDHIRNDLVDAVKYWGWRTCAIIRELEGAITCHNTFEYRIALHHYESLLRLRSRLSEVEEEDCRPLLRTIDSDLNDTMKTLTVLRHPKFGCVFKSMSNETVIAYQLLRFADVYTSRVDNFLKIPLNTQLFPRRRLMAHDINLTAQIHE